MIIKDIHLVVLLFFVSPNPPLISIRMGIPKKTSICKMLNIGSGPTLNVILLFIAAIVFGSTYKKHARMISRLRTGTTFSFIFSFFSYVISPKSLLSYSSAFYSIFSVKKGRSRKPMRWLE